MSAQDTAVTDLNRVAPARVGTAKLRGTQGCAAKTRAKATIAGTFVAKVVFYVDGKKVKTLVKPNDKGKYSLVMNPRKLRFGAHRVKAVITFRNGVSPKSKTLTLTFTKCRPAKPKFTG